MKGLFNRVFPILLVEGLLSHLRTALNTEFISSRIQVILTSTAILPA